MLYLSYAVCLEHTESRNNKNVYQVDVESANVPTEVIKMDNRERIFDQSRLLLATRDVSEDPELVSGV